MVFYRYQANVHMIISTVISLSSGADPGIFFFGGGGGTISFSANYFSAKTKQNKQNKVNTL